MFIKILSLVLMATLTSLSSIAQAQQMQPISTAIQTQNLGEFFRAGEAVHKYIDEMLIGEQQAGRIDWVIKNYELNLRLGAIDGGFTVNDLYLLTAEQLNSSLGRIHELNSNYREMSLTDYETDHKLNLVKIGFLHAVLLMKSTSLANLESYTQILNAFNRGFIYPFGHSTGAVDPRRSVLILDLLVAYSLSFPIDYFEQISNNTMVNSHRTSELATKKFLVELSQNLAFYGAQKGKEPSGTFDISEDEYRFRLAARALNLSENNKFLYSRSVEILKVYRSTALTNGYVREAKKAFLKEIWITGFVEKPIVATLLVMSLWGSWFLGLGAIFSIGYRKWRGTRTHIGVDLRGKKFKILRKYIGIPLSVVIGGFQELVRCIYNGKVRSNYTVEIAILMFSLSWLLNDYLGEIQILLAS